MAASGRDTARPFPRANDGLGHAWGLREATPTEVWERFSADYEAQAERVWDAFAARGWAPSLEWAGGQDGEAVIGRDADGEIACLFHLEDPHEARRLARAIAAGRLDALIDAEH